jgi:hypothetical protein
VAVANDVFKHRLGILKVLSISWQIVFELISVVDVVWELMDCTESYLLNQVGSCLLFEALK